MSSNQPFHYCIILRTCLLVYDNYYFLSLAIYDISFIIYLGTSAVDTSVCSCLTDCTTCIPSIYEWLKYLSTDSSVPIIMLCSSLVKHISFLHPQGP